MRRSRSRRTISQERSRLIKHLDQGTHCEACTQWVQRYPRRMYSTMAVQIMAHLALDRARKGAAVHVREIAERAGTIGGSQDYAKFKFWGLIKPVAARSLTPVQREYLAMMGGAHKGVNKGRNGRASTGFWKLTKRGRAFAEGRLAISPGVVVFNDHLDGRFLGPRVTVKEVLGTRFDYQEVMAGLRVGTIKVSSLKRRK